MFWGFVIASSVSLVLIFVISSSSSSSSVSRSLTRPCPLSCLGPRPHPRPPPRPRPRPWPRHCPHLCRHFQRFNMCAIGDRIRMMAVAFIHHYRKQRRKNASNPSAPSFTIFQLGIRSPCSTSFQPAIRTVPETFTRHTHLSACSYGACIRSESLSPLQISIRT